MGSTVRKPKRPRLRRSDHYVTAHVPLRVSIFRNMGLESTFLLSAGAVSAVHSLKFAACQSRADGQHGLLEFQVMMLSLGLLQYVAEVDTNIQALNSVAITMLMLVGTQEQPWRGGLTTAHRAV